MIRIWGRTSAFNLQKAYWALLESGADPSREFAGKIAPLGRVGQPQDVAEVALFLASDESRFVTGSAYFVDGGWTAGMTKAIALV